jgi:hypothetical protein
MTTFNPEIENPGSQELRKFGLISGIIVAVLFGLALPWLFGYEFPLWPWIFAGCLGVWALAHPASLFVVYRIWLKFGHVAGWINTRIILGIMFYFVFLPAGIIMRLLGKDPMARSLDSSMPSYRKVSDPITKDHVERPY